MQEQSIFYVVYVLLLTDKFMRPSSAQLKEIQKNLLVSRDKYHRRYLD